MTPASGGCDDPSMSGALADLRVLDLSWGIAGALGVLLLAEQGADVIKVEPPGGDPFRDYSGYAVWNRSRRSVTLDLKNPAGVDAFHKLADSADVIVETFRPGVMDRLGVGYDTVHARNPRLVYASCPAYPDGHRWSQRPGYDALVQASSGQQWEQPGWRMGPIFLHVPLPSMAAMFLVPTGILAALVAREETGRGQHVRTSLFQGALLFTTQIWTQVENSRADFFGTMVKSYPARRASGDDLRSRRRRVGAHVDHERARAGEEPGRDRRRRRRVRSVALSDALGRRARPDHPAATRRVQGTRARRVSSPSSARTTMRSKRSTRWKPHSVPVARHTRNSCRTT